MSVGINELSETLAPSFEVRVGLSGTPKADWALVQSFASGSEAAARVAEIKGGDFDWNSMSWRQKED